MIEISIAHREIIGAISTVLGDTDLTTMKVLRLRMKDDHLQSMMTACTPPLKKGDMDNILGKVAAINKGLGNRNERTVAKAKERMQTFVKKLPMAVTCPGTDGL